METSLVSPKGLSKAWGIPSEDKRVREFLMANVKAVHSFAAGKRGTSRLYSRAEVIGLLNEYRSWRQAESQPADKQPQRRTSLAKISQQVTDLSRQVSSLQESFGRLLSALGENTH